MTIVTAAWLIVVAGFWGATNPFIKRGSKGIESIKESSPFKQFIAELLFLITNWKYLLPFLINQAGSVLYYITLASADLSLAVPITNSLTFIFTAISGHLLGERIESKKTIIGMLLVVCGVTLCVLDKIS
ncbi:transmembrane protein 234 homolog [Ruditapes philippinarum]|uniref:transmembrane protein 234 homolog n=1 Tax=Ruditapes philippinarum TaxID=129788 RepID=UPI00295B821B|nr:transmembrane protein 234 homolog [Ruditapes philippinarum]